MSEEQKAKKAIEPKTILGAATVAVVLIIGIAVGVIATSPGSEPSDPQVLPTLEQPANPNAEFAPDNPKPQGNRICSGSPTQVKEILEAPNVVWVPVEYGFFPSNAKIGPGALTDDGIAHCWAPTMEGAVAAAYNYMYASNRRADLLNVVDKLAYHDAYVESQLKADPQPRQPYSVLIHSFKTQALDDTHVVVNLILEVGNSGKLTTSVPLTWDGDWKVQILPIQGGFPFNPTTISEEHDYIPFTPGS